MILHLTREIGREPQSGVMPTLCEALTADVR